jgi:hypothetical protein
LITLKNPMNPGFESEDYIMYKSIIKKIKSVKFLDGLNIDDELFNNEKKKKANLFDEDNLQPITEEIDGNDLNSYIKLKKRQSTITYSQRMLKKADNLTKFNRKNHSEGNKHITNSDL